MPNVILPTADNPAVVHHGEAVASMDAMPADVFDSIVTDPPYALTGASRNGSSRVPGTGPFGRHTIGTKRGGFMGKEWDATLPGVEAWAAALRVLKPGGYMLAMGGTRTFHRLACAIEDAGFEMRDTLMYIYGSGFPKGRGCLKPCYEPILLCRKPGPRVLPLNIDECRITIGQRPNGDAIWEHGQNLCGSCAERAASQTKPTAPARRASTATNGAAPTLNGKAKTNRHGTSRTAIGCSDGMKADATATSSSIGESGENITDLFPMDSRSTTSAETGETTESRTCKSCGRPITSDTISSSIAREQNHSPLAHANNGSAAPVGRWPGNLAHDGSDEVMEAFGAFGERAGAVSNGKKRGNGFRSGWGEMEQESSYGDTGTAARFFYTAKASRKERGEGNNHPTVKPLALMRWLCKLVTPPGGLILDPFGGSGTTAKAAVECGFRCLIIEQEAAYVEIARRRLDELEPPIMRAV